MIKATRNEKGKHHSFNDEPSYVDNGTKIWHKNGKIHRDNDLPAIIYGNGVKYWYKNGRLHREKGPAIVNLDGENEYFLNGKLYTFHEWLSMLNLSEEEKTQLVLENA